MHVHDILRSKQPSAESHPPASLVLLRSGNQPCNLTAFFLLEFKYNWIQGSYTHLPKSHLSTSRLSTQPSTMSPTRALALVGRPSSASSEGQLLPIRTQFYCKHPGRTSSQFNTIITNITIITYSIINKTSYAYISDLLNPQRVNNTA
jgi:hypothetical protein